MFYFLLVHYHNIHFNRSLSVELGADFPYLPICTSFHLDATHPDHGLRELNIKPQTRQPSDGASVDLHYLLGRRVPPEPLVRLRHPISIPHVLKEAGVELILAGPVQRHSLRAVATTGALGS